MKFTEGYWLRSERIEASYASQGFLVVKIENGMRIVAAERPIYSRADAMNISTITIDFVSYRENDILVKASHYEAYEEKEPRFELKKASSPVEVSITDSEAVMTAGKVSVRVNRKDFCYQFEAEGRVITSCGFRNLGYIRYDKKPATMFPEENYLASLYTPYMMTELSLRPGECVYGFGEQFTAFVKNGQVINCWNEDGGTSSQIAYKNIPFYMTNEGYGIFVDHSSNVSFEVASEKVEYVGFSVEGEELRYHFIYGPGLTQVLEHYTELTGRPALPPAWSFGLWLTTSFTTSYDETTTSHFIDGMAERDIPLRVFHFDCYWMRSLHLCDFEWDEAVFHDVPAMLKRYKEEKKVKICVWINPYIAQGTEFFREGADRGYFLKRADGKGVKQVDFWQPGMAIVDFTNPEAAKWYTDKLKTLLDAGVDCFKTDFAERIPIDVAYYDGSNPKSMHNYYTYLYNKAVFELLKREKGEQEAVLFARSATAGCQQFPVHWGGDCSASYASMAETLRGGLSITMSGFSFWSHDISGFEQTATPDLYKRWVQFGLLSTHSRLHGSGSYRVPWLFDEEACDVLRYFTNLKCQLMPYIYEMAVNAHETGIPVMRPMILEYPKEPGMSWQDMQYMLGKSLLVAPIFHEEGRVSYYLPEGKWVSLLTDEIREGGSWYTDTYDYFGLPLYVRENTLLARGSQTRLPDYDYADGTVFHLYQLKDGCSTGANVPDIKGKTVLTARAEKEGNILTLQVSSLEKKPKFILHHIERVKEVKGGKAESCETGLCIIPSDERIEIVL
ncbi:alpha-D-xyloside xylohydrolase [Anaerocolumna jejuensis DSM 15929]|uniref:alpha-D-xyloside xylohydrolase n=1 Tax=Anaerocolumna jejuensis DSM 15929 TaxID=1121322 RepID=A0A1M7D885_9FIRM|nr:alpha-xylosidase [Anaerocolumna jejuensis]SHL75654.1 alpha-D-xyloside xylohydrolase [Anaerocolumna jejuensis DSM 15929]